MKEPQKFDTIVIGAGAAGMMCAIHAATHPNGSGGTTLVVDHAKSPGEKIRISGGGRCNFTNLYTAADRFISQNPHFAKSALKRYTQWDFIDLVANHGIPYHEKTLGQLFCDTSAKDIIALLLKEMSQAGAKLQLQTRVADLSKSEDGFLLTLEKDGVGRDVTCENLVVACGGLSIPKMGATGLGFEIAEQFGHTLTEIRPALVPLTFDDEKLARFKSLSGVSLDARVSCGRTSFDEAVLFTHRGLSGPAILQISSYWTEGQAVSLHLSPGVDIGSALSEARQQHGKRAITTVLSGILPKRLAADIASTHGLSGNMAELGNDALTRLTTAIQDWKIVPTGTEGYRTAEVTAGGVDTAGLDSKTMESKIVRNLYFIGEVVDVTGWLGGYNFQWAWSSGWAAGTAIASRRSNGP